MTDKLRVFVAHSFENPPAGESLRDMDVANWLSIF